MLQIKKNNENKSRKSSSEVITTIHTETGVDYSSENLPTALSCKELMNNEMSPQFHSSFRICSNYLSETTLKSPNLNIYIKAQIMHYEQAF